MSLCCCDPWAEKHVQCITGNLHGSLIAFEIMFLLSFFLPFMHTLFRHMKYASCAQAIVSSASDPNATMDGPVVWMRDAGVSAVSAHHPDRRPTHS